MVELITRRDLFSCSGYAPL